MFNVSAALGGANFFQQPDKTKTLFAVRVDFFLQFDEACNDRIVDIRAGHFCDIKLSQMKFQVRYFTLQDIYFP